MNAQPPPSLPRPRAVLDTSVLFSAHRHWLWLLARLGYYKGVWSTFIVGELVRIRVERSIALGVPREVYRKRVNNLIHLLSDVLMVAPYREATAGGVLRDPDDEPILATALASGASYVVSLNTRDFPPDGTALGVRFLTPHDFLAALEGMYPEAGLTSQASDSERHLP